jgi:PTH1 family peptidyl-tRNA hydrolase
MKLIFAQGNPGQEFDSTRHNVGWACLDAFAAEQGSEFASKPKFFASIADCSMAGEKVLLVKPTTFYNDSGRSARTLIDFYKLDPSTDLLVLHDELALDFGTLRIRHSGSDAGNNGIKSLNTHVGVSYTRLRIGIWNELRERTADADFVLAKFNSAERDILTQYIVPKTTQLITQFTGDGLADESFSLLPAAKNNPAS